MNYTDQKKKKKERKKKEFTYGQLRLSNKYQCSNKRKANAQMTHITFKCNITQNVLVMSLKVVTSQSHKAYCA